MTRRILSFLLSVAILFGIVFIGAPAASAAYDMKASEKIIELIKKFEGFASKPYQDNGQWSVGYGTGVSGPDLKEYQERGITYAEADALMRRYVADFETDVNDFARTHGLKLSQNQFDALISFTYNLGSDWMNNDSAFRRAVIKRDTSNEFIFSISRWCAASGKILEHLIERRLAEANVYINGVYNKTPPENYRYVLYYENIDKPYVNDVRVQGFDCTDSVSLRSQPTKSGYRFLGWYTLAKGGEWITAMKPGCDNTKLYAHWQLITDPNAAVDGVASNYQRKVGGNVSGIVREAPSHSAAEKNRLAEGTAVTITADYLDGDGNKWGKLSTGGWIVVHTGILMNEPEGTPIPPVTVSVLQTGVNIRTGPGTNYSSLGTFEKGDELTVTAIQNGGLYLWGLTSRGWICLKYTNYDLVTMEKNEDFTTVSATGTVYRTDKLNVRSGPGTKYELVGQLKKGDFVTITAQMKVNSTTWGKTELGWVSLYYIELGAADAKPPEDVTEPSKPEAGEKPDTVLSTGEVVGCAALNIRAGAGTKYAKVGKLNAGTQVRILEKTTVYGQTWGRIEEGWISLNYIREVTPGKDDQTPSTPTVPDDQEDKVIDSGVIVKCTVLNVREGAGTKYAKVGKLKAGTRVEIYEKADCYGQTWGRTDQGWISLYYFSSKAAESKPEAKPEAEKPAPGQGTGATVVNCSSLNIRENAGTQYAKVGKLARGTRVTILEQVEVKGKTWGRIAEGWVHMYYIKLDGTSAETPGSGNAGGNTGNGSAPSEPSGSEGGRIGTIVKTKELTIREAAGTGNPKVGTISQGTKVVILETTKVGGGTWGRIDRGWISLYYVQLSDEQIPAGSTVRRVTTNGLNIRTDAGTGHEKVGTYSKGTLVVILEQKDVNGQAWGRTDKGWISLNYTE